MSVLIAVDKFKGSLSQSQISEIVSTFLDSIGIESAAIPLADGGDGSVAALISLGWQRKTITVVGPLDDSHEAAYAVSADGKTVALEVAELCGIKYLNGKTNPWQASSSAVGQAIKEINPAQYKELLICVGGSASVDGGVGILQALGVNVFNRKTKTVPGGLTGLMQIRDLDFKAASQIRKKIFGDCRVTVLSDTENPLLGSKGAVFAFGKQKGLNLVNRIRAELAMRRWFQLCRKNLADLDCNQKGTGSAGGIGFVFHAFLGAQIISGAQYFLEQSNAAAKLENSTMLITGEGRIDKTTLSGKGPYPLLKMAQQFNIPAVLICGSAEANTLQQLKKDFPIAGVISLENSGLEMSQLMSDASHVLKQELARNYSKEWK